MGSVNFKAPDSISYCSAKFGLNLSVTEVFAKLLFKLLCCKQKILFVDDLELYMFEKKIREYEDKEFSGKYSASMLIAYKTQMMHVMLSFDLVI